MIGRRSFTTKFTKPALPRHTYAHTVSLVGVKEGRVVELRPNLKPWFLVSLSSETGALFTFLYDGKNRYAEVTPDLDSLIIYTGEQRPLTTADRDLLLKIVQGSLTQVTT